MRAYKTQNNEIYKNIRRFMGRLEILEIEIQTEIANQKIELLKKYI